MLSELDMMNLWAKQLTGYASQWERLFGFGYAIEAEVRKSDEALIRQLVDAADPLQGAANWLAEAHGQFSPVVLSGCLMIGYNRAKRLHDAALAARKQGASHDR